MSSFSSAFGLISGGRGQAVAYSADDQLERSVHLTVKTTLCRPGHDAAFFVPIKQLC